MSKLVRRAKYVGAASAALVVAGLGVPSATAMVIPGPESPGNDCSAQSGLANHGKTYTATITMTCSHRKAAYVIEGYVSPGSRDFVGHCYTMETHHALRCTVSHRYPNPPGKQSFRLLVGNETHWIKKIGDNPNPDSYCERSQGDGGTITCDGASMLF